MRRWALPFVLLLATVAGLIVLARSEGSEEARGHRDAALARPATAQDPTLGLADVGAGDAHPDALLPARAAEAAEAESGDAAPAWRGIVIDAQGRPLAGARVLRLPTARQLNFALYRAAPENPSLLADAAGCEAGADGAFTLPFTAPPENLDWSLLILHPTALARLVKCTGPLERGGDCGTIALDPACMARGRVLAADGSPAAGADIDGRLLPYSASPIGGDALWIAGLRDGLMHERADADGRFELGGLPAASLSLGVEYVGHLPLSVEARTLSPDAETDFGELQLRRGDTVSGRVVDAQDQPVAGAEVRAAPRDLEIAQTRAHGVHAELRLARGSYGMRTEYVAFSNCVTTTDADGRFTLGGLHTSHCGVLADAAGFDPVALADVPVGAGDVVLQLAPLGRLRLLVLDAADDQPLGDAELRVFRVSNSTESVRPVAPNEWQPEVRVERAGPGEFVVNDVCAAPFVAWVHSSALGDVDLRLPGLPAGEIEESRTLRVSHGGRVAGRVVGGNGAPLPSAQLYIEPYGRQERAVDFGALQLFVGEDGSFGSTPLPAGAWAIVAKEPGRTWAAVPVDVPPGQDVVVEDIVLQQLATLDILVLDAAGSPAASMTISASDGSTGTSGSENRSGATAADGKLRLLLAPAAVRLECRDPPLEQMLAPLAEGEQRAVTLQVRGPARLSGIVSDASGPVAKARVSFKHGVDSERTTTDAAGAWSLSIKAAVPGRLSASSPHGGYVVRHLELQSDESRVENLQLGSETLRCRVVDETGAAVPSASIQVSRSDETLWGQSVAVDADGRVALANLEPATWKMLAYAEDLGGSAQVEVVVPGESAQEVLLRIDRLATVSGVVRSANGQSVARECRVSLLPKGSDEGAENCFVEHDGSFSFKRVKPGDVELIVTRSLKTHEMDFDREELEHLAWLRIPLHLTPGADVHQDVTLPPDRP